MLQTTSELAIQTLMRAIESSFFLFIPVSVVDLRLYIQILRYNYYDNVVISLEYNKCLYLYTVHRIMYYLSHYYCFTIDYIVS